MRTVRRNENRIPNKILNDLQIVQGWSAETATGMRLSVGS